MKFEVFGRELIVERGRTGWLAFYPSEGKRRLARDVIIPDFVAEENLAQFLADLFHESASPNHPDVRRVE